MKLFLNILIFCFVFLQSVTSISQNVTASVESDSTLIGKELIYTIDVNLFRNFLNLKLEIFIIDLFSRALL